VSLSPQAPIPLLVWDDRSEKLEPLLDNYPEQEHDDEDHEHECADCRGDAELENGWRDVLPSAPGDPRDAILLVSTPFLDERCLPAELAP
jgi:hypothetical protein